MIIQICDICCKEVKNLNTLVLYKQSLEYCDKCSEKAKELQKEFKKELDFELEIMNNSMKEKEKKIIKKYRKITKSS